VFASLLALRAADNEQHFIKYVLAFFAGSDGIVLENLAVRFMQGEVHCGSSSSSKRMVGCMLV
jgi:hypothetical protein